MCRCDMFCEDEAESNYIPPWSTFQVSLETKKQPVANIEFQPIIIAPPTDYRCVNALGHTDVPVYFDMGLRTKALEITWVRPDEMYIIIPCEGGMYLLMSVFAAIGFLHSDAGVA